MYVHVCSDCFHKRIRDACEYVYVQMNIIIKTIYEHSEDKVSKATCNVTVNNIQLATFVWSLVVM